MKRSEMVKIIKSQLESLLHREIEEFPCELLLDALEDVGMQPPSYMRDLTKEEADQLGFEGIISFTEWEPEDE